MRCIICLKEAPASDEHIFPDAIGGAITTDRVCKTCNGRLGSAVDAPLVNHPLVAMQRSQLGVAGTKGRIPDVFAQVFGIGTLAADPAQRLTMSLKGSNGVPEVKLLYKRATSPQADGTKSISIVVDAADAKSIPLIIERERMRAGLLPLTPAELEQEAKNVTRGVLNEPAANFSFQIDLLNYQRGVIKIAYELAWRWLGETYLDDPQAANLRAILQDQITSGGALDPHGVRGAVRIGVQDTFLPWRGSPNSHLAIAMRTEGKIVVAIRLFQVMSGGIVVSDKAASYPSFAPGDTQGIFLEIDPVTTVHREATLLQEIANLSASGTSRG